MAILTTIIILVILFSIFSVFLSILDCESEVLIGIIIFALILIFLLGIEANNKLKSNIEIKLYKKVLYENKLAKFDENGNIILIKNEYDIK